MRTMFQTIPDASDSPMWDVTMSTVPTRSARSARNIVSHGTGTKEGDRVSDSWVWAGSSRGRLQRRRHSYQSHGGD